MAASEASISNAPEFAQAHYGKSLILLTQARLEQAWPEFEWRIRRPNFWPQRHYGFPIWDGGSLAKKLCWFIGSKDLEISFSFAAICL